MIGKNITSFHMLLYYSRWDKKWLDRIIIVILEGNIYWSLQIDIIFWSAIRVFDHRCIAYLNSQNIDATIFLCDTQLNICIYSVDSRIELFVLFRIKFWAIPRVLCRSVHCLLSNVFTREFRVIFSILNSGSVGVLWSDERLALAFKLVKVTGRWLR